MLQSGIQSSVISLQASEANTLTSAEIKRSNPNSERYHRMQRFMIKRTTSIMETTPSPLKRDRETYESHRKQALRIIKMHKSPVLQMLRRINESQTLVSESQIKRSTIDNKLSKSQVKEMSRKTHRSLSRIKSQRVPINAASNLDINLSRTFRNMIRENLFHNGVQAVSTLDPEKQRQSKAFYDHLVHLRQSSAGNSIHQASNTARSQTQSPIHYKHTSMKKLETMMSDSQKITNEFKMSAVQFKKFIAELSDIKVLEKFQESENQQKKEIITMIREEPKAQYNYKVIKALAVNDKDLRSSRKKLYQLEKFNQIVLPQKRLRS